MGGGIDPDIEIESPKGLPILMALMRNNCVFKFGNEIYQSIEWPNNAKDFALTDEIYIKFQEYLEREQFPFSVYSEEVITLLEEALEEEEYLNNMEHSMQVLKTSILDNKKEDLIRHELEIRKLISNDLILRHFYQNGVIEHSLNTDTYVAKAIEILNDPNQYADILAP